MTPTLSQKREAIRQACIAANPDKDWRMFEYHELMQNHGFYRDSKVTIADVLLAIDDNSIAVEAVSGQFGELTPEGLLTAGYPVWDLRRDSLDDQDEATIDFIYSILCV